MHKLLSRLFIKIPPPKAITDPIKPAPAIPGILTVLSVDQLLAPHLGRLAHIKELAGLSEANFARLYQKSIHNFARFVQLLPASEIHHHAHQGGLLEHTLEVCVIALKIRRSYVLSANGSAEEVSAQQDMWTYAVFLAALCHDLAKPVVHQIITVYDQDHQAQQWVPWQGVLDEQGTWYLYQFSRKRVSQIPEKSAPLLTYKIIPDEGMAWLSRQPTVLLQWLASVSGDADNAGSIGEIVSLADRKSIASNLGAESNHNAIAKPLHEKIITSLRYLLQDEVITLNSQSAAGWVKGEYCWLLSKRTLNSIRAQLAKEGHSALPSSNGPIYDLLQAQGVLSLENDAAIFKVTVSHEDWSHKAVTVMKIPVSKLWNNPDHQPDQFAGALIPYVDSQEPEIEKASALEASDCIAQDRNVITDTEQAPIAERYPETMPELPEELDPLDFLAFFPSTEDKVSAYTATTDPAPIPRLPQQALLENTAAITSKKSDKKARLNNNIEIISQESEPKDQAFFLWLRTGIKEGRIKTNIAKARVHTVQDGVILITPGIFQDFSIAVDNKMDWQAIQKIVFKKKRHTRGETGLNVMRFTVQGQNRQSVVSAIFFKDLSLIFGAITPPSQSTHITKIS